MGITFSDQNFSDRLSVSGAPNIIKTRKTNQDAENFLQEFIEWCRPSEKHDAIDVPQKKKPTIADFRSSLKEHKYSWKSWQYAVRIKMPLFKGDEKKEELISVNINLMQAVMIKKDLEKVKCITDLASEKGLDLLHDLLEHKMKCQIPDGWKISSNVSWISNATTVHLATFWHVESLVHFLEICPHSKDIQTENSKSTPLHVAASCDDETVVTSLLIHKGASANAKMDNHQTPLHIAAEGGFIKTVITLLFEGEADVMAKDMQKGEFILTKRKH